LSVIREEPTAQQIIIYVLLILRSVAVAVGFFFLKRRLLA
jgi:hypothetical protein